MNQFMLSPVETIKANMKGQEARSRMPLFRLILLGIMAGAFIALGAAGSNVGMHNIANVGVARLVAGSIFPVGLMMIVFIGGELFTGDCMMITAFLEKKCRWYDVVRVLIIVWFANLVGSVLIAALVYGSGQLGFSSGLLGAFTIKVGLAKATISPVAGVTSGILCNIFVCGAVLLAGAAKSAAGKVFGIFFPIMVFVVSGYEHCVANMYYIPAAIFAAGNADYVAIATEQYGLSAEAIADGLTWKNFFLTSSPWVTLGNIIGGMVVMGVIYFIAYKKDLLVED
ncbi:MAG: formate/nitrite transporter family protein [Lachnospiraceae bacterium]|nr:formate/nitrite transporter family protein [Lachnospiraceae bacterium]